MEDIKRRRNRRRRYCRHVYRLRRLAADAYAKFPRSTIVYAVGDVSPKDVIS